MTPRLAFRPHLFCVRCCEMTCWRKRPATCKGTCIGNGCYCGWTMEEKTAGEV